jgi:hypothetical protein
MADRRRDAFSERLISACRGISATAAALGLDIFS